MARILLGVSGGISAYKAVEICRVAMRRGHSIRVIQTPASLEFVGRASFEGVTGAPVLVSEFERDPLRGAYPGEPLPEHDRISHLELVRRCDAYCIAPASANTIAKLAAGLADNLLTSAYLACASAVAIAPAMNNHMYQHPATQANLRLLRERGVHVIEPDTGPLASRGEWGVGRLAEPERVVDELELVAGTGAPRSLDGTRVLVTAGGTREPVDAVRYLGNRSSGRMGIALAEEAARRGAAVTVVAANVSLPRSAGIEYVDVESAEELRVATSERFRDCDVLLMAAAVADYRPSSAELGKIDKEERAGLELKLVRTTDVVAELAQLRRPGQVVIGFAAEHGGDAVERARGKLERKGLDAVVLNDVSNEEIGFDADQNEVTIIDRGGEQHVSRRPKPEVAVAILDHVESIHRERSPVHEPGNAS
jgi:phosphopantothenoylcysteine decarboxylase / phosphopantothenate---cysteine ligase